jgi:hypothetical protein
MNGDVAVNCKIHPNTQAVATCEACGTPICEFCRAKRRQEPLCYPCSWDRDDAEGTSPTAEPVTGLADELVPLPEGPGAKGWLGGSLRYALATALTGGAATLLALAWWKFTALLGHDTWYYAVFTGGAVGLAARFSYGPRRGTALPVIAALAACYAVFLNDVLGVSDQILSDPGSARFLSQLPLAERVAPLITVTARSLTPLGWLEVGGAGILAVVVSHLARPLGVEVPAARTKQRREAEPPPAADEPS